MKLISHSAPHWLGRNTVPLTMRRVLLALMPVIATGTWFFGPALLLNLTFACLACMALEAAALGLRGRSIRAGLTDCSALVTGVLLALTLPPLLPWWVTLTAAIFAIALAKHVYGGLGQNPFNPAMVGYVAVLISFPQYVADWPALTPDGSWPATASVSGYFLHGASATAVDALSGATPLDQIKTELAEMRTIAEITGGKSFGLLAGYGWEWINLAALIGGLWLLRRRVFGWHASGAMLATLGLLYFGFYALNPASEPSPLTGLLSGGTMLAAFFIVTDPVSGAASNAGRIIFGAGTGVLCFAMRTWGAYPDGIAFAVLLMNMAVPLIDRWAVPRVYGHRKRP